MGCVAVSGNKMNSRPQCYNDNCTKEAFIVFGDKLVCGSCYYKYYKSMQNKQWEKLKDATN